MKYPALDVSGADTDLVLAVVDDFAPSAVEDLVDGISIFFADAPRRDAAHAAVVSAFPAAAVSVREVDDEDWARRSQETLTAVTVGRITVAPPWCAEAAAARDSTSAGAVSSAPITIVITPSMGFGTGHHVTTRLCLAALQQAPLAGARVLDVGTGSGVLAIAASVLGARSVLGIDFDADAVASARENLEANPRAHGVSFETVDVRDATTTPADLVLANLTGGAIVQSATMLASAVANGGSLILSGIQSHERDEVLAAFAPASPAWVHEELGWVGIRFNDWTPTPV